MEKIFATKQKMSQVWDNDKVIPVTILKFGEKDENRVKENLKENQLVKISGISKGKGFQGVVKRHGFGGGPKSHGQKDRLRAPGSIGPTAPQRTLKGRKMPGHMGQERTTLKNLRVVKINPEERIIFIKGALPGMRGTKVEIHLVK